MTRSSIAALLLTASTALSAPTVARGEPTRELYIEGRKEVFEGDPISTRLTTHARIRVGLAQSTVIDGLDAPVTRLVRTPDGTLWVGTAGKGLWRWQSKGEPKRVVTEDLIITALVPWDGGVLFASADDGVVHHVRGEERDVFARTEARYVWDLSVDGPKVWAVTGEPGTLLELGKGRAQVRFEADERHLRSLDARSGVVVFGGGEKGVVYRKDGSGARALFDSSLDEATDVWWDEASQSAYAGFVSSNTKASLPSFRWIGAVGDEKESDDSPFKGSELVRIDAQGRVDLLWRSQGEGLMELAQVDQGVVFSTGGPKETRARLYRVAMTEQDQLELVARLEDRLAPAFAAGPDGSVWVGTGGSGSVVRFGPGLTDRGEYRSTEQDFQRVGRIGRVWFDADLPRGSRISISIRSGNTAEVDATWSDWSREVTTPEGGAVEVPEGRYAQFRALLKPGTGGASPSLRSMHASVVRLNDPPQIHEVFPLQRSIALEALPLDADQDKTVTLSSGVLDKLRARGSNGNEDRQRVRQLHRDGHRTIAWHASDTNGDELVFRVEVQPEGSTGWTELARDLPVPFHSFDSRSMPDGHYAFRVTANDRPSNTPRDALTSSSVSAPVLVDNTPPVLSRLEARPSEGGITVTAEVRDVSSPVVEAYVSVDGGPWLMLPAEDGLVDSRQESLRVLLVPEELGPFHAEGAGVRTISVRARDDAGNEVVASVAAPATR